MTVYVDDMRVPARIGKVTARWSWLSADGDDELHKFAEQLGLKRAWFQDGGTVTAHYDVTDAGRARAIELGAVPVGCFSPEAVAIVAGKVAARGEVLTQREAHRIGLCVDCKAVRHSAGRPRCDDCHRDYTAPPRPDWAD